MLHRPAENGNPPDAQSATCSIRRGATNTDALRISRYEQAPEYGPRILFFSGGTALNALSRRLTSYTHNSIHIVTPFDSGGSSGVLRGPFGILGVGDLRSRIMSLADRSVRGQSAVVRLFAHRLPKDVANDECRRLLDRIIATADPLIRDIPSPMREIIRRHVRVFAERMPADLDLRGASIGNLVLVGGYLNNLYDFHSVVFLFSQLVEARGMVRPVVTDDLHLAARLDDGTTLIGQHAITGKERPAIESPIRDLFLVKNLDGDIADVPTASDEVNASIRTADLIVFPMGSFYTSVLANLLPHGVSDAVRAAQCPKVYVPNTSADPEQFGMRLSNCVNRLNYFLRQGSKGGQSQDGCLDIVLLNRDRSVYEMQLDCDRINDSRLSMVEVDLVTGSSRPHIDEQPLIEALLSLT